MHRYTLFLFSLCIITVIAGVVFWRMHSEVPAPVIVEEYTPVRNDTLPPIVSDRTQPTTPPSPKPLSMTTPDTTKRIVRSVPFTSQAPTGQWKDDRFQDGCEEASVLMAMRWVQGSNHITPQEATTEIVSIAAYEQEKYGTYHDTSAEDTLARIIIDYFQYTKASIKTKIGVKDIRDALYAGGIVIAPMNGQKLGNPNFTRPGPERHMLVVIGYDPATDEFITNDPGTRKGAGYRYSARVLVEALLNYPTGYHESLTGNEGTSMIVVSK